MRDLGIGCGYAKGFENFEIPWLRIHRVDSPCQAEQRARSHVERRICRAETEVDDARVEIPTCSHRAIFPRREDHHRIKSRTGSVRSRCERLHLPVFEGGQTFVFV